MRFIIVSREAPDVAGLYLTVQPSARSLGHPVLPPTVVGSAELNAPGAYTPTDWRTIEQRRLAAPAPPPQHPAPAHLWQQVRPPTDAPVPPLSQMQYLASIDQSLAALQAKQGWKDARVEPNSGLELAGKILLEVAPIALGYALGGVGGAALGATMSSGTSSEPRAPDRGRAPLSSGREKESLGAPSSQATVEHDARLAEYIAASPSGVVLLWDNLLFRAPDPGWAKLTLEQHCITIARRVQPVGSERIDCAHPLLLGAINRDEQLWAIESEDGGFSRIHIVNLQTARTPGVLRRHGGGVIEEGCYLLHPKREDVIVPLKTYHADMLQEMTREAKRVMGRLGAKRLTIETTSGVTLGGGLVSNLPFRTGNLAVDKTSDEHRKQTYEWGPSTYDPADALEDCVWIRDNAGLMTIVDQRRTSNLTRYEESSQVDTSFSVSLDVMKLFEAKFSWAEKSTYRYVVEFFDRPAHPRKSSR